MANKVKQMRIALGWSQAELARRAKTSQQQIQRIEAGKQAAKLDLVTAICSALGKPMDRVFPGAGKAWTALNESIQSSGHMSKDALGDLRETGIDADPRRYTLKVLIRGHKTPMFFPVPIDDLDRVFRLVQEENDDPSEISFVVFDSDDTRVAINLRAVMFVQFLTDIGEGMAIPKTPNRTEVEVYLAELRKPVILGALAESPDEEDSGQLNHIFFMVQCGESPSGRFQIVDEDGETAFIRAGDITVLKVPLWLLDPDERIEEDEADEPIEDKEAE